MDKMKIVELVIMASAALLSAAKYVIKFIDYIVKVRNKDAAGCVA
jgi:hypothetical protein